jgi:hypothetical protein
MGGTRSSKCCAKGRVNLLQRFDALQKRPIEMISLFDNPANERIKRHLLKNILHYNSNLSFGRIGMQQPPEGDEQRITTGERHKVVKINGMIENIVWDYNPPGGQAELRGQLFTLPPRDVEERLSQIAAEMKDKLNVCY